MSAPESVNKRQQHFILIHGLCHGAWCWYKLSTLLQSTGHRVTALDLAACGTHPSQLNELRSFTDYVEPLMQAMRSVPPGEKVILVGHSFGGLSVSLAMEKFAEKIMAGVFVAAVMPCVENPNYVISKVYVGNRGDIFMDCEIKEKHDFPNQLSSIKFSPSFMSSKLYQNCPIEDLELAKMLVRPGTQFEHDEIYNNMITREKYGTVPRVYVVCQDDRISSEQFQRWMIEQSAGTEMIEIPGADHMVMLSKPKELFDVLQEIANKYS